MKDRKKLGIVMTALLAVVALLLLAVASTYAVEGPAVMVTGYTMEPAVLMPGDTGTITLTIKNMDTQSSETETIVENPSLTSQKTTTSTRGISAEIDTIRLSSTSRDVEWLSSGTQRTEYLNVGALGPGESITISFPLKAATFARDGTYYPEVYIEVDNGDNVRFPVPVKVDSSEVLLLEEDIPSEISLGESKNIAIAVANNRPNIVEGVNVFVKKSNTDFEFTPEGLYVGNLGAYEQRTVKFTVNPRSEGIHDIAFEASYKNGNNVHSSDLTSSITVTSRSDVRLILVDAPEFVYQGEVARIEFDVANGMTKDIKAVSVVPLASGLKLLPSEYFIGDMEVGDVFSASFDLYTTDMDLGETSIPFNVMYTDIDTDKQYKLAGYEVQVEIREQQKSTVPNQAIVGVVVVILVVVGVVVWVRARRKRARETK
ncbi:MAG: hypothetical protein JW878_04115 [Methanomicrobia archaeon]|nr:hypothetical protein [Methanomicrobia archaeon]